MYHLVSGLIKQYTAESVYSILIIGLDNAGKTSFFEIVKKFEAQKISLFGNTQPPSTIPTVGLNVSKVLVEPGSMFQLWDLGGQESLRPLWAYYMQEASGVIFVIDSCDIDRFPEARDELFILLKEPMLKYAPVIVLANKQDMVQAKGVNEIGRIMGLSKYVHGGRIKYEVDEKDNETIDIIYKKTQKEQQTHSTLATVVASLTFSSINTSSHSTFPGNISPTDRPHISSSITHSHSDTEPDRDLEEGVGVDHSLSFDRDILVLGASCVNGLGLREAIDWMLDKTRSNSRRTFGETP